MRPRLMVTDPPYGVEYDPQWRARAGVNRNTQKLGHVTNDDRTDWTEAWRLFRATSPMCGTPACTRVWCRRHLSERTSSCAPRLSGRKTGLRCRAGTTMATERGDSRDSAQIQAQFPRRDGRVVDGGGGGVGRARAHADEVTASPAERSRPTAARRGRRRARASTAPSVSAR